MAAEQLILTYQREEKFPACSIRLFSVYGERERPDKLYPKVIDSILNERPFLFYLGSEKHLRSFTYVGDIVDGLVLVLKNYKKCEGEIINLGLDTATKVEDCLRIIEDYLGKKAIYDLKPPRSGDQLETRANIEKARAILGYNVPNIQGSAVRLGGRASLYNPTTRPEVGLKKEVDWFRDKIWKKIDLYQ